jgi:hypothetical protein
MIKIRTDNECFKKSYIGGSKSQRISLHSIYQSHIIYSSNLRNLREKTLRLCEKYYLRDLRNQRENFS